MASASGAARRRAARPAGRSRGVRSIDRAIDRTRGVLRPREKRRTLPRCGETPPPPRASRAAVARASTRGDVNGIARASSTAVDRHARASRGRDGASTASRARVSEPSRPAAARRSAGAAGEGWGAGSERAIGAARVAPGWPRPWERPTRT
eukprot:31357-Pelagococcus_subviridis.AAC.4